ncbi:RNA polymerase sigma factor [Candidatus Magnetomonas plexicatena]|uniref:RNA polymerase sigma factor n=1 Tax=Candidatus Magnetomonas plexicatena TaxID=2552947 RepID=UPI001C78D150|nr:RNA polymerase sigma factor [Nitrospirales bacterium LBB_01]
MIYIEAVLSGDKEAFNELVRRYKRKVFAITTRFTLNSCELDDICQEAFIRAYTNLNKYRADAPFEHWLIKITINCCYDALRKQKRRTDNVALDDVEQPVDGFATIPISDKDDSYRELYAALDKLSVKDKMIIILLELEEKSVREVAQLTGWSETNVKVRAFRARMKLRGYLGDKNEKQKT